MIFFRVTVLAVLLLPLQGLVLRAEEGNNLLSNTDFSQALEKGKLPGWTKFQGTWKITDMDGVKVLELTCDDAKKKTIVEQKLKVDPQWKFLRIKAKVWVKAVVPGEKGWQLPAIIIMAMNAENKPFWPVSNRWDKPTDGWITIDKVFPVKPDWKTISISPAILNSKAELLIKELSLEAVDKK